MLRIENHGPLLIASNFWESEEEAAGKFFLSTNAGAFRLLVPRSQEPAVSEMATAREVIVSRGPWPAVGREDAIELLFDDRTDTPFALHFSIETLDRLPLDTDVGREWIFSAWTVPRRRGPHKSLERPCWYRRVARIPCLQTRGFPREVTAERKSWLKNVSTARRSAPRSGLAQSRSAARPRRKRPWNWSRNPRARRSAPCSWTAFRPRPAKRRLKPGLNRRHQDFQYGSLGLGDEERRALVANLVLPTWPPGWRPSWPAAATPRCWGSRTAAIPAVFGFFPVLRFGKIVTRIRKDFWFWGIDTKLGADIIEVD